jgi:phenylacetate-CoA ligase
MPLIRYRVGDIVALSKELCGCGRNSYLIKSMEGRADDLLILPDGRKMSTGSLWLAGQEIEGIKEYQIVQEDPSRLTINFSKMPNYKDEDIEKLIRHLRNHIGEGVEFERCCHEKVPLVNGKFKFIISNLNR